MGAPYSSEFTVTVKTSARLLHITQGCHPVREKQKFFKVREKSGNFAKSRGKSQFLSKSVKSPGIFWNSGWKVRKFFGIQGIHGIFREFTGFWTQGQWKLFWGQWKVREKSGKSQGKVRGKSGKSQGKVREFLGSNEWQPCYCLIFAKNNFFPHW